jgi:hypothetical protein
MESWRKISMRHLIKKDFIELIRNIDPIRLKQNLKIILSIMEILRQFFMSSYTTSPASHSLSMTKNLDE